MSKNLDITGLWDSAIY